MDIALGHEPMEANQSRRSQKTCFLHMRDGFQVLSLYIFPRSGVSHPPPCCRMFRERCSQRELDRVLGGTGLLQP